MWLFAAQSYSALIESLAKVDGLKEDGRLMQVEVRNSMWGAAMIEVVEHLDERGSLQHQNPTPDNAKKKNRDYLEICKYEFIKRRRNQRLLVPSGFCVADQGSYDIALQCLAELTASFSEQSQCRAFFL